MYFLPLVLVQWFSKTEAIFGPQESHFCPLLLNATNSEPNDGSKLEIKLKLLRFYKNTTYEKNKNLNIMK